MSRPIILPGMVFEARDFDLEGRVKHIHPDQLFGAVTRISGESPCPICNHPAQSHPMCGRILSDQNEPFLHVLCNGKRVKL